MPSYVVTTVRDLAVGAFGQPIITRSRGEAERSFMASCAEPGHAFRNFAKDFVLYYIGEYDDQLGLVRCVDTPQPLLTAQDARTRFDAEYKVDIQPGLFQPPSAGMRPSVNGA